MTQPSGSVELARGSTSAAHPLILAAMHPLFTGLLGLAVFLALAWALSLDRKRFPWRTVACGLALQFTFGFLILKTGPGRTVFAFFNDAVTTFIGFADRGTAMVFGPLASAPALEQSFGAGNGFIFAVVVLGTIILVSAVSSFLYHYGILQLVVRGAAWVMRRVMRTSGSESLSAAANIFMGQTEAPLVIKPYLPRMTRSELLAMMTGGMATIAGGVLAVYARLGVTAGDLLTASVMNAPAGLLIAKILLPETERSETAGAAKADVPRTTVNGIDALCVGAADGLKLALNVCAMLIAFVAVVHLANFLLAAPQQWAGATAPVTLQTLLGWINTPFAWLMGVPARDSALVGQVLGERIVLNEFVGYLSLTSEAVRPRIEERSFRIAVYAICGFANFASVAIQIGGISALVPERRADLASLGLRAMLGGLLACYLTATLAGMLL
ncbi:MAG TPA: nucleoside transporter C-terminal domain-containing protein [Candidatus Omnitrophota bacterium]|nr:nucleoside transporter C-terminal domain-containing protein [Candidatus Omnitrophota bacterium]